MKFISMIESTIYESIKKFNLTAALFILLLLNSCNKKITFTDSQLENTIAYAAYLAGQDIPKEIYIIKVSVGSFPIRITYTSNEEESPVWMDTGNVLLFKRCNGRWGAPGYTWHLYAYNMITGEEKRINPKDTCDFEFNFEATEIYARQGIYILNYSNDKIFLLQQNRLVEICSAGALGLTTDEFWGDIWGLSIDNSESLFALQVAEGYRIHNKIHKESLKYCEIGMFNVNNGKFEIITNDTFPDDYPSISPDGKYVAFTSFRTKHQKIFIADLSTKETKLLTDSGYSPTWSPDGKRIAFISDRDGHSHIYVINADGTGLFQLTKGEFEVWPGISWSPR